MILLPRQATPPPAKKGGVPGFGIALIVIFVLAILAVVGWIVFTRLRAQRLGLPPPSLSSYIPSGPLGIVKDRVAKLRRGRTRNRNGAGFEDTSYTGAGGQRVAAFDTDETWDARVVDNDPYGGGAFNNSTHPYEGASGGSKANVGGSNPYEPVHEDPAPPRGRSRTRDGDDNPFSDRAEVASINDLRGVSPRPMK